MSVQSVKSKFALTCSIDKLAKNGWLRMWTFTLPVVLDVDDATERWRLLLHELVKELGFSGVRVFELHESHGLHVHCVVNKFYPVSRLRAIAQECGWGRIHVQRCNREPYYVAKYVSKARRDESFKGHRLWASFGDGRSELVKVKDIAFQSPCSDAFKSLERKPWVKELRQSSGRLVGKDYSRYMREGNQIYWDWLCGGGDPARTPASAGAPGRIANLVNIDTMI